MDQQPMMAAGCENVKELLHAQLEAMHQRLAVAEQNIAVLNREVDGHVDKLWERVNQGFDEIKTIIASHAKDDSDAMHRVESALMTRVPAWALLIMTGGGSIIGGLATYVLTHK